MSSTQAREKAINVMNEEGKELTAGFLMQQLEVEYCNAHHKSLSQLDFTISVNFAAYDHQKNKGKSNKTKSGDGTILEHKDLLILVINLENPQGWRESA